MSVRPPVPLRDSSTDPPVYDNEKFQKYSPLPNEHTLEANATSQQLSRLSHGPWQCTASGPSRYEEGAADDDSDLGEGYDIKLDTVKLAVFQHKSPKKARVRGPADEYQMLYFEIDMEQVYTLVMRFAPGQAFIACPAIPETSILSETLLRTVFVDPYAILLELLATREPTKYLLVEYNSDLSADPHVGAKYVREDGEFAMAGLDQDPYYQLYTPGDSAGPNVYTWREIECQLWDCEFGVPVRNIRDGSLFDDIDLDPNVFSMPDDDLPDEYDTIDDVLAEIREKYDEDYQSYLARAHTLNAFANGSSDEPRRQLAVALIEALFSRIRTGQRLGLIADRTDEGVELPAEVTASQLDDPDTDVGFIYETVLEPRRKMDDPLGYGLSDRGHYYLQR